MISKQKLEILVNKNYHYCLFMLFHLTGTILRALAADQLLSKFLMIQADNIPNAQSSWL